MKHRGPRIGRNPRNGASVPVPDKHVPFFRAGKLVHDRLNQPDYDRYRFFFLHVYSAQKKRGSFSVLSFEQIL